MVVPAVNNRNISCEPLLICLFLYFYALMIAYKMILLPIFVFYAILFVCFRSELIHFHFENEYSPIILGDTRAFVNCSFSL